MGSLTLTISYQKNVAHQAISAAELKAMYLKNIPLLSQTGVVVLDDDTVDLFIKEACDQVENELNLMLTRMAYQENRDFMYDDWIQWGYFPVTYPVVAPYKAKGLLGTSLQIDYPTEWLSSKTQNSGDARDENFQRTINLVPLQGVSATLTGTSIFVGQTPYSGYFGNKTIPNYWQLTYVTGFNKIPPSIVRYVALQAVIQCLTVASGNVTGQAGVASKSLGIDGLSQSVTTTATASKIAFGALIDVYQAQMDKLKESLKSNYVGITIGSL
jgi:hypothetical protein